MPSEKEIRLIAYWGGAAKGWAERGKKIELRQRNLRLRPAKKGHDTGKGIRRRKGRKNRYKKREIKGGRKELQHKGDRQKSHCDEGGKDARGGKESKTEKKKVRDDWKVFNCQGTPAT